MRHVPHLYLGLPWRSNPVPIDDGVRHHLERVLRFGPGAPVTYTDGSGRMGRGTLVAGGVERGDESTVAPPTPSVTIAVAPPKARDRQRFLVEKLAELGVGRLVWLTTNRGEGRPPKPEKAVAWAVGALEQSRRAHLMTIEGPVRPGEVSGSGERWVADAGGSPPAGLPVADRIVLLVGPEGGFDDGELAHDWVRTRLNQGILRVETAAIAGASVLLAPQARGD